MRQGPGLRLTSCGTETPEEVGIMLTVLEPAQWRAWGTGRLSRLNARRALIKTASNTRVCVPCFTLQQQRQHVVTERL